MMKKAKRNVIATSLVSVALSSAIISGATYALFTSESKTNIAVTSGTVDVVATIDEESLKTYSGVDLTGNAETDVIEETAVNGTFTNGGTAKLNDNGDLDLVNVTPGDKVTLNINIKNNSDVAVKYQTIISSFDDSDLIEVLKFTINGNTYDGSSVKSSWSKLEADEDIIDSEATIPVEVLFPTDVNNDYQEKYCTVSFIVKALQANAYIADDEEDRNKRLGKTPVFDDENGTVTYGLYPQIHVSNETTISALDALTTADSNGWYLYNDEYYAKKSANPCNSGYTFNDGTTIVEGTEYWFKCEPIEWKILTSSDDSYSLVSTVLLDTHRYNEYYSDTKNGYYANNYLNSEIRSWLNDDFLNTAFNLDSSLIQTTTVDNSASTTNSPSNSYACANTEDKIYLLSYKDYCNSSYFSSNSARTCKTTDYARANYISYSTSSSYYYNGYYWTRSPSSYDSMSARCVDSGGFVNVSVSVYDTSSGVRPAITIKL